MNQTRNGTEQGTIITLERPLTGVTVGTDSQRPSMELLARRWLAEKCTYAFCFKEVTFSFFEGILTLEGRLPSFYLKQVLQTLLRDLDGVTRINNRVDVVSSVGLAVKE